MGNGQITFMDVRLALGRKMCPFCNSLLVGVSDWSSVYLVYDNQWTVVCRFCYSRCFVLKEEGDTPESVVDRLMKAFVGERNAFVMSELEQ